MALTASEREDAILADYLRGDLVPDIKKRYKVGSTVLYDILRRSGKVPLRSQRRTTDDPDRADAMIAGLHDLVEYQAKTLVALRRELDAERRASRARQRKRSA
jgi:hypothetical protein